MKKIMTILAIIALIFPFANVFAFEVIDCATNSSCYVHPKGAEVNFYKSEKEANQGGSGTTALTLSDGGSSEQFVKVLWGEVYDSNYITHKFNLKYHVDILYLLILFFYQLLSLKK